MTLARFWGVFCILSLSLSLFACSVDDDDDDDIVQPPNDDDSNDDDDDDDDGDELDAFIACSSECPGDTICNADGECYEPVYPVMHEAATVTVSHEATGENILINGRRIRPASPGLQVGTFPSNLEISPDGAMIVVNENGFGTKVPDKGKRHVLRVIDPATMTLTQELEMPNGSMFHGLAFSADGKLLYVSGGQDESVHVYDVGDDHLLTHSRAIFIDGCYTSDLALDQTEEHLFVTCVKSGEVARVELVGDSTEGIWKAGTRAYTLLLAAGETELWVSNWNTTVKAEANTITILNALTGEIKETLAVGLGPEGMLFSPDRSKIYSINATSDEIIEIDVAAKSILRRISLHGDASALKGIQPLMGDITDDGNTMYVASAGDNCVNVVDLITGTVSGRIPAEWYTTDVALSPDGQTLYATNGKGKGDGPSKDKDKVGRQMFGSVIKVGVPDPTQLSAFTATVDENNARPQTYFDTSAGNDTPLPDGDFVEESPIKYVFWVMKENLTWDSIFGDLGIGRGDPDLVLWGEEVTPNQHALARQFTLFDAFFCDSEGSVDGHQWASAATNPDYVQKSWILNYGGYDFAYAAVGVDAGTFPESEFVLPHLVNQGINVRSYGVGENFGIEGVISDKWDDYYNADYPFLYSTGMKDRDKAAIFVEEFNRLVEEDRQPSFTFILLPNDHTNGLSNGTETPTSMIADNDEGLGMVVDAISKSKIWKESIIFVFEDDTQHAYDHLDSHRGPALAIGPWVKRGYVSSATYSYPNLFKTMEMILGSKPITRWDEMAVGMYDIFTAKPNLTPYDKIDRTYPEEIHNGMLNELVKESAKINWDEMDEAEGAAEFLWKYRKGTRPPEKYRKTK